MRISDWSSDVCSSDLPQPDRDLAREQRCLATDHLAEEEHAHQGCDNFGDENHRIADQAARVELANGLDHGAAENGAIEQRNGDRKSVVLGKSVSVRVDLGGRSLLKKKNNHKIQ